MPSPVGHALGGVAVGWLVAGRAPEWRVLWRQVAILAAIGIAPDLDLLFDRHSRETHSIGAAVLVGAVAAWRRWPIATTRPGIFLGAALAWLSHPILDTLAVDTSAPLGVMLFWPFWTEHLQTGWAVFTPISRRYWLDGFVAYTALAVLREVLILGPLAYVGGRRIQRISELSG